MDFAIEPMQATDLDAVNALVMVAYQSQRSSKDALLLHLTLQPEGTLVVKQKGTLPLESEALENSRRSHESFVGFGATIDYGSFAYIALMSVHPSAQKQGLGRALMERLLTWLDERGCPTVLLDASPAGVSLYRSCGFHEIDRTLVMLRPPSDPRPAEPQTCSPLREENLAEVSAFDALAFGADRQKVLRRYWEVNPQHFLTTRATSGEISGYLIARPHTLGPWVARGPSEAAQLLAHALTLPFQENPAVLVSAHHTAALRLLSTYGFQPQRTLSHMQRGRDLTRGRTTTIYGQATLGMG